MPDASVRRDAGPTTCTCIDAIAKASGLREGVSGNLPRHLKEWELPKFRRKDALLGMAEL